MSAAQCALALWVHCPFQSPHIPSNSTGHRVAPPSCRGGLNLNAGPDLVPGEGRKLYIWFREEEGAVGLWWSACQCGGGVGGDLNIPISISARRVLKLPTCQHPASPIPRLYRRLHPNQNASKSELSRKPHCCFGLGGASKYACDQKWPYGPTQRKKN